MGKKHRKIFREQDIDQLQGAQEILSRFPDLTDPAKEIPDADPFVVALAIIENTKRQDTLFKSVHCSHARETIAWCSTENPRCLPTLRYRVHRPNRVVP
jgi:hypothetical protein